jgi:acetyl-CoA acetyltransferase
VTEVAVVAYAARQQQIIDDNEIEMMAPVIEAVRADAGLGPDELDFTCSGSSDFLAGAAFSFVMTVDATRPVPPIVESHVEMDGAWALYEAWVKLQLGEAQTALVYGYGKSSPGSLRDVLATQLDPYSAGPLKPDAFGIAGLQARYLLDAGDVTEQQMAEIASRSLASAESNPIAIRKGQHSV